MGADTAVSRTHFYADRWASDRSKNMTIVAEHKILLAQRIRGSEDMPLLYEVDLLTCPATHVGWARD